MPNPNKVKVIKKGEAKAAPEQTVPEEESTKRSDAREMVTTVTTWVSDFKKRKRRETQTAVDNFFSPQPVETHP